jgi:hypothetical protein
MRREESLVSVSWGSHQQTYLFSPSLIKRRADGLSWRFSVYKDYGSRPAMHSTEFPSCFLHSSRLTSKLHAYEMHQVLGNGSNTPEWYPRRNTDYMRFDVQMVLIWIMTPCSLVGDYEHFEETWRLQSQSALKMEETLSRVRRCAWRIITVLDRMIGFIDTLVNLYLVTFNRALPLIYTLSSSPLHTHHDSHFPLVVS